MYVARTRVDLLGVLCQFFFSGLGVGVCSVFFLLPSDGLTSIQFDLKEWRRGEKFNDHWTRVAGPILP
jgi:hypothetical protein